MRTYRNVLILSAELATLTAEANAGRTADLIAQLEARGLSFTPTEGKFAGTHEKSFAIVLPAGDLESYDAYQVTRLAERYSQDSILHLDANRAAYLLPTTGSPLARQATYLGKWRELTVAEASVADAWTRTADGRYWHAAQDRPDPGKAEAIAAPLAA